MADFVFNISLGRVVQYALNVQDNDPAASIFRMHAWVTSAADDLMNNADTVAELEAVTGVTEATPYTNQIMTDADITVTVNDTTNLVDVDSNDVTFTAVASQTAWDTVTIAYNDAGDDTDANSLLQTSHLFDVTPNGGDITAVFAAAGWFQAT